jgi:hypothetical protein
MNKKRRSDYEVGPFVWLGVHAYNQSQTREVEAGDQELKDSLGYTMRLCFKNK